MKEYFIDGEYVETLGDFIGDFLSMGWINPMHPEQKIIPRNELVQIKKKRKRLDLATEEYLSNLNRFKEYIDWVTPDDSYVILHIINSAHIRDVLGYAALEKAIKITGVIDITQQVSEDSNDGYLAVRANRIKDAKTKVGPTMFDYIIEMINRNPKIHLRLE